MKRLSTETGLTLVATAALGVASAGQASAHQFVTTGPLSPLILVLSDNPQVFEPKAEEERGFRFICKHFRGHGIGSKVGMTANEQIVTGSYSSCKAEPSGIAISFTPVEYLVSAEGSVGILRPIVLTIPADACSLKISSGTENAANGNLQKLLFLNISGSDLLVHVELGGIHLTPSGGVCGAAGTEFTTGTYRGLWLVRIDGGTIRWE